MNRALSYIKFLFQSFHLHGIHSPFVYQLEQECFKDKTHREDYKKIKQYRQALINDKSLIDITDFGTGSRVTKSNRRTVIEILKNSSSNEKSSQLLYRLVRYTGAKHILELGTNLGAGAQAMALNSEAEVTSAEGCPNLFGIAQEKLRSYTNIKLMNSTFADALPKLHGQKWDLIFIDGHHDKEATLDYFEQLLPSTHNDSVIIFDDINWSKGMQEAWEDIKANPSVKVTVDTFFWGLVFFREEQAKEHFKIRL